MNEVLSQHPQTRTTRRNILAQAGCLVTLTSVGTLFSGPWLIHQLVTRLPPQPRLLFESKSYEVYSVVWAPDGSRIASAHGSGAFEVWNPHTGQNLFTSPVHGEVHSNSILSWSPDSRFIVTSFDNSIWDLTEELSLLSYAQDADIIAWSPNGKYIASDHTNRTNDSFSVNIWDAFTGKTLFSLQDDNLDPVTALAWSPDSVYMASASFANNLTMVRVWNALNGKALPTYYGPKQAIYSLSWSPDGKYLASASADRTVQIWNPVTGKLVFTYRGHSKMVYVVSWSPDGKSIASAGEDRAVQIWDPSNGKLLFTYYGHPDRVTSLSWSPDSKSIASASQSLPHVHVWDIPPLPILS